MREKFIIITLLLYILILIGTTQPAPGQNPGKIWLQFKTPEQAGWSSEKLSNLYQISGAAAMLIVYNGKIAASFGDIQRRYKCHSLRKSLISALYGIHAAAGHINLDKTLGDFNIDDVSPLTDPERGARVIDLLKARSGVYHPAGAETEQMKAQRPQRGSHSPGTFWYYNNWDFNVLGTIFEKETAVNIFKDFFHKLAGPLQMEDFRIMDGSYDHSERDISIHPAYTFKMSARDLARFGQLYLQNGRWNGKQIIPEQWIKDSITPYSSVTDWGPTYTGYGYLWWLNENFNGTSVYFASGHSGHFIGMFPAEQVVVVLRADTYVEKSISDRSSLIRAIFRARDSKPVRSPEFIPYRSPHLIEITKLSLEQSINFCGGYKGGFNDFFGLRPREKGDYSNNTFYIMLRNGGLVLERYHYFYSFRLLPVGENELFVEDLEMYLVFHGNDNGDSRQPVFHKSRETAILFDTVVKNGIAAGIRQFDGFKDRIRDELDLKFLASNLIRQDKYNEALEILRLNVLKFPRSIPTHRVFINHHRKIYDLEATTAQYKTLLKHLNREKQDLHLTRWFTQWLYARTFPVPLTDNDSRRYTGDYDGRHITVENGYLIYHRRGPRRYRLLKVSRHVFVVDDDYLDGVRFEFEPGSQEKAEKMIAHYIDGGKSEFFRQAN